VIGRLTGQRFGLLTVQNVESQVMTGGDLRYWCRCDCGRTVVVFGGNLRSGRTRSCGTHRIEFAYAARYEGFRRTHA
jgi:hypothetical protein